MYSMYLRVDETEFLEEEEERLSCLILWFILGSEDLCLTSWIALVH